MSFNTSISTSNTNWGGVSTDLADIFPNYEILTQEIIGSSAAVNVTFTLSRNKKNDTNYFVFPQMHYNTAGTSGTYTNEAAYGAIPSPLLIKFGRTSTQFTVYFTKSTGDNYSGTLVCLVIYNR
jgi:formylmethanofuran dehydrogenase subunit A